jgi:predicted DNA-binding transcriptional regulator YafY
MPRKTPEEILKNIAMALMESKEPLSLNELSKRSGVYPSTLRRYIELILRAQAMPKIEVIETKAAKLIRFKISESTSLRYLSKLE